VNSAFFREDEGRCRAGDRPCRASKGAVVVGSVRIEGRESGLRNAAPRG
jgi:hypothetical protein